MINTIMLSFMSHLFKKNFTTTDKQAAVLSCVITKTHPLSGAVSRDTLWLSEALQSTSQSYQVDLY